ncbi:MAG TPA: hypothetical protein PK090_08720 [Smithellaceae bacterium]|nr:hypothetical protein [Smithellaceae bacterium]
MKRHRSLIRAACFIALGIAAGVLAAASPAQADPPQEVALSYDNAAQVLTVSVTHKTLFSGLHYVKRIDIKKNGAPAGTFDFKSQPDKKTFSQSWPIEAKAGDTLTVTAECNLQGNTTATLVVGAPPK